MKHVATSVRMLFFSNIFQCLLRKVQNRAGRPIVGDLLVRLDAEFIC